MKPETPMDQTLIELQSYGIVVGTPGQRPLLLLKGKGEGEVLPVWLSPLEATLAVSGSQPVPQGNSLVTLMKMIESLGAKIVASEFVELAHGFQYVDLVLENAQGPTRIRARADEAMALCLSAKARFFATREFMERCRARQADEVEISFHMGRDFKARGRRPHEVLN